ncbi:MAG: L-serine ammonia-lyase, iron-sulfur-dependent, subunit alpha [Candidatus Pelethousia sp.]|nr:L-serine ammonia-lyase, iron-sulfur-dependent, subunit alpha [Candidatus Pelethousia sp.]
MKRDDPRYDVYVHILKRELIPAMGCTEPIAIAYCAAMARAVLGTLPERVVVEVSGNIIKNVKSVIVPNTNGHRGIQAAAAIGILAGDETKKLEVLSHVSDAQKQALPDYLQKTAIEVRPTDGNFLLEIGVYAYAGDSHALVRIANAHTNIVQIERNGKQLQWQESAESVKPMDAADKTAYDLLSIEGIYAFALGAELRDVAETLDRQIAYNTAIAEEGLRGDYGANIGSVLLKSYGQDTRNRAKARAAAGSDARMNGCDLPVIINSGSGNQGITASLPVVEYAQDLGTSKEELYRALLISNLCAIHQKTGIGALSAYCGAVSAGAGAGAGIAYLRGGKYREVAHTIVNTLAITSGIVCDGAKASCAAKIATAVDAGILGYDMFLNGQQFLSGDGLVSSGVENTICNIGRLGREGMRETDREIIQMMTCDM